MKSVFRPVLSGVCLLSASTYSFAEDVTFDDMTVTATRSERSALEVPASVSRKSGDEVVADRAVTQRELFNSISGVRVSQSGSGIGHFTSIRLPTTTRPYYLFLQDGIPVQSSGFFNHNALAYTNFSSAGSVEVLKGAGTALYGSDAIGGTVNVISSSPYDNLGASGSFEFGDNDFRRYSVTGGAEIDDRSAASVHISHTESDGFRDHSEFDRQEFSFDYINDLDDKNTVTLAYRASRLDAEITSSINDFRRYRDNPDAVGDNVERVLELGIDPTRRFDFDRLSVEWQHSLNDITELSAIGYLRANRNRFYRTFESESSFGEGKEKTAGLLLKADMDFGQYRVIAGLDAEYTEGEREQTQEFNSNSSGTIVPQGAIFDYDVDYTGLAPYVRLEVDLTDKFTLGLGARYDYNNFEYTNNIENGEFGSGRGAYFRPDSGEDRTFNHFSPKVDLSYRIDDVQTVYARYANGFRVPQVSTLYSLGINERADSFDEEVTDTYEIGYKLIHQEHQFETAIYHLVIDDTIDSRRTLGGNNETFNAGKTLHSGIELSLASQWTADWATKIAYSYSEHEFDDNEEFGENEQANAPQNLANVRLIYTPKAVSGLYTILEWEHVGSSFLDDENTEIDPGYDIANLKMSYEVNNNLTLFGRVNNLTNRLYAERATLSFGRSRYSPAAPRQGFFGFEYKL